MLLIIDLAQHLLLLLRSKAGVVYITSQRLYLTDTPSAPANRTFMHSGTLFSECLRTDRRKQKVSREALFLTPSSCPLKDESRCQSQGSWRVLQMDVVPQEPIPKATLSVFLTNA